MTDVSPWVVAAGAALILLALAGWRAWFIFMPRHGWKDSADPVDLATYFGNDDGLARWWIKRPAPFDRMLDSGPTVLKLTNWRRSQLDRACNALRTKWDYKSDAALGLPDFRDVTKATRQGDCDIYARVLVLTLIEDYGFPPESLGLMFGNWAKFGFHCVARIKTDRGTYVMTVDANALNVWPIAYRDFPIKDWQRPDIQMLEDRLQGCYRDVV